MKALADAIARYRASKQRLNTIEQFYDVLGPHTADIERRVEDEFDVAGKAIINWTAPATDATTAKAALTLAVEEMEGGASYLVEPMVKAAQAFFDAPATNAASGTFFPDFDFGNFDSDGLAKFIRTLQALVDKVSDQLDWAPYSMASEANSQITEFTQPGVVLKAMCEWLQYQQHEAYQTLRTTRPPGRFSADYRALDLMEFMAQHSGELADIAQAALTLEKDAFAVFPREVSTWANRYLQERANG